jgi:hypothetical protein
MNINFYCRIKFTTTLYDNVDVTKLINSITKINKTNNIFKLEKCDTSDPKDCNIYIFIKNNILTINFSHLYYDGYSIGFIFEKIDQIYKNEIKKYTFKVYDTKYSTFNLIKNSIKMIPRFNYKNIYNAFYKKRTKKTIKILKTELNEVSTKEITYYIVDTFKIKNYCLTLNARKKYTEYEGVLGNLVHYTGILNKNRDINEKIQNNTNYNIEKVINYSFAPPALQINSYLNFKLPSFMKYFSPPNVRILNGNYVLIHPVNNNEKYIIVDYYYFT